MTHTLDTLTATIEDMFGVERKIKLVRQPDGQYRESDEVLAVIDHISEALSATVEGRFGEEHHIKLVRQANGEYGEDLTTPEEL